MTVLAEGADKGPTPPKSTKSTSSDEGKTTDKPKTTTTGKSEMETYGRSLSDEYGHLVTDGTYYYRLISAGSGANIVKMAKDGTVIKTLAEVSGQPHMLYSGGYLFYTAYAPKPIGVVDQVVYRMKTDGTEKTIITQENQIYDIIAVNGKIYCTIQDYPSAKDRNKLVSVNFDGTGRTTEFVGPGFLYHTTAYKGDLIFGGHGYGGYLIRYNIATKTKSYIMEDFDKGYNTSNINIVGDYLYFVASRDFMPSRLIRVDLTNNSRKEIKVDFPLREINMVGGYVYYYNSDERAVYRTKLGSTEKTKLKTNPGSKTFTIFEGLLSFYWTHEGANPLYPA